MGEFSISERYRLEVRWGSIKYKEEGLAVLNGCYLTGPVIPEVYTLNENDFINLDFVNQYSVFINRFYIAKLSWVGVRHAPNKILLFDVLLNNKYINSVPKLKDNDCIVVDTKLHEVSTHQNYLTYIAYLVNGDGMLYKF